MTDILAPAVDLPLRGLDDVNVDTGYGTSLSAPMVTATVALMDEFAEDNDLHPDQRNHQVRKALIMNGADKMDDALGSNRTIKRIDGTDWEHSSAYNATHLALDRELGVGMLNVKNTIDNLTADKQAAGTVPTTGWDFGEIGGQGTKVEYVFEEELSGWFSATLTWDRHVVCSCDDDYEYGAQFFNDPLDEQLTNLDLYLVPAEDDNSDNAIDLSVDPLENVEHIFWNIETPGMYKLVVFNTGDRDEPEEFGLAWRSGSPTSSQTGDYDNDGDVDGRDFLVWQRGESPDPLSASDLSDWQNNYGTGPLAAVSVPEPSCLMLLMVAAGFVRLHR